jgi:DNA phosphorothioation-associated putative methyltransferase
LKAQLIERTACQGEQAFPVLRNLTALRRMTCSKPVALALGHGIITETMTVFDYGCGYGTDVRYLRARKIKATGWDPHYHPHQKVMPADVVNLGFVLNVIENQSERDETLARACMLAKKVLIVAVRVEHALEDAAEFNDGVLTKLGTFQKLYRQGEFREYIEGVLERRAHVAALGVVYVFSDAEAEANYVAARAFTRRLEYRTDLIEEFKKSKLAGRYVSLANRLGRLPLPEEFQKYPKLIDSFGSAKRIDRLTLALIDKTAFQGSRAQRREDILTYLAMLKLEDIKPPRFSNLPGTIQSDIKAIWKTYAEALSEGEQFLFNIGKPDVVASVCETCRVGKLLPSHLYVHRSAEDELPPLLRVLLFAGKEIIGEVPYDLVKFAKDGRAVSFLLYKDFDGDPHPSLLRSVKVYLPKATFDIREYFNSDNPPILHRKELFVLSTYPHFETFRRLTEQEDSFGVLSSPDIGYRRHWEDLLRSHGICIDGHSLVYKAEGKRLT